MALGPLSTLRTSAWRWRRRCRSLLRFAFRSTRCTGCTGCTTGVTMGCTTGCFKGWACATRKLCEPFGHCIGHLLLQHIWLLNLADPGDFGARPRTLSRRRFFCRLLCRLWRPDFDANSLTSFPQHMFASCQHYWQPISPKSSLDFLKVLASEVHLYLVPLHFRHSTCHKGLFNLLGPSVQAIILVGLLSLAQAETGKSQVKNPQQWRHVETCGDKWPLRKQKQNESNWAGNRKQPTAKIFTIEELGNILGFDMFHCSK